MIKVKFVSIEDGILAIGFRRMVAIARKYNPDTQIYFIPIGNQFSILSQLIPNRVEKFGVKDIKVIAQELAKADLLCFSCLSASAPYVEMISAEVKRINPKTFIVWGGIHCILNSEDAIKYVDAIFIGEGEKVLEQFYHDFSLGNISHSTLGMWFNSPNGVLKNDKLPLNTSEQLSSFPHLYMGLDCDIYDNNKIKFRPFTYSDYLTFNGQQYKTIWTLGCPHTCSYCQNDTFIKNDPSYAKIRFPSVDYFIAEIEKALKIFPFISTVLIYDDNFISLPLETTQEFSRQYKLRIGLPFVVFGLHPHNVTTDKLEALADAGLLRVRMGIQSGNENTLNFYNRKTSLKSIYDAVSAISKVVKSHKLVSPAYDIIVDNPLENKQDIITTLNFLYTLERPFTLNILSLRFFPQTKLYDYFDTHKNVIIQHDAWESTNYSDLRKTFTNLLYYIIAIGRPPKWAFNLMLKFVQGYADRQKEYPLLHIAFRGAYFINRVFMHAKRKDYSVFTGGFAKILCKRNKISNNS